MNFEMIFWLIGLPTQILVTAIICYTHTEIKQEMALTINELKGITQFKNSIKGDDAT